MPQTRLFQFLLWLPVERVKLNVFVDSILYHGPFNVVVGMATVCYGVNLSVDKLYTGRASYS